MRCKKGDLAIVVRDDYAENIGKFVTVIRRSKWEGAPGMEPGIQWECEPHSPMTADLLDERGRWFGSESTLESADMPDAWLRPIRPQSDDAQDESLSWLPTPVIGFTKETAE